MTIWKERRWTTTDNKAIEVTVWYHKLEEMIEKVCIKNNLKLED